MFGLSRPRAPAPATTPPAGAGTATEARRRHVASLFADPLFRTTEVQTDLYEAQFASLDAYSSATSPLPPNLVLLISLPPSFPESPPNISLKSPGMSLSHPWLEPSTMRVVGHPAKEWTGRDPAWPLGRVVADIVREFQLNPPRAAPSPSDGASYGSLRTPGRSTFSNWSPAGGMSVATGAGSLRMMSGSPKEGADGTGFRGMDGGSPQRSSSFQAYGSHSFSRSGSPLGRTGAGVGDLDVPLIDRMTDEEVNELMTDPDAFQSFFLSLDPVKSMNAVSKELRQGNELLARKTLAKEEDLRQLQSTVREKLEEMRRAKAELEKVAKEKETLLARYSPQALVGQLASLAHTSDMESESIAEAFIAGVKSTEDFLKEFREERRLYHLRSGKAERARGSNLGS